MEISKGTSYRIDRDVYAEGYSPSQLPTMPVNSVLEDFKALDGLPNHMNLITQLDYSENQFQRGTCATFAVSGVAQFLHNTDLSEQHLYNLAYQQFLRDYPGESGEGTSIDVVCAVLKNRGICQDGIWPYDGTFIPGNIPHNPVPAAVESAAKYKLKAFRSVGISGDQKAKKLCELLFSLNVPVIIAVPIFWQHCGWEDGIFIDSPPAGTIPDSTHALSIIGFNIEKQFLIIRNSWGPNWGLLGTSCISFDYINKYLSETFILEI